MNFSNTPDLGNASNLNISNIPSTNNLSGLYLGTHEKYYFNEDQIGYLKELQSTLEFDAKDILRQAKTQNYRSIGCQIMMITLGLVTSYISAVSDIDSTTKTYLTASFALGNAFVSGMYSLLKFSKHSAQLFGSYQQLREKDNKVNSAIINGYSNLNFEALVEQINKTITQNEFFVSFERPQVCSKIKKPINSTKRVSPPQTPGNSNSSTPNPLKEDKKEKDILIEIKDEIKDEMKEEIKHLITDEIIKQFLLKKKELTDEIIQQVQN
jgi:hypothetical protein